MWEWDIPRISSLYPVCNTFTTYISAGLLPQIPGFPESSTVVEEGRGRRGAVLTLVKRVYIVCGRSVTVRSTVLLLIGSICHPDCLALPDEAEEGKGQLLVAGVVKGLEDKAQRFVMVIPLHLWLTSQLALTRDLVKFVTRRLENHKLFKLEIKRSGKSYLVNESVFFIAVSFIQICKVLPRG